MEIKPCPFCGRDAELEKDLNIFHGQIYIGRYPHDVANQDHGYKIRCVKCGCQTCWWHYRKEVTEVWNKRTSHPTEPGEGGICPHCGGIEGEGESGRCPICGGP